MKTFWRLIRFLRPYPVGVALSLLLAAGAMVATVLIPAFSGRAVDAIRADNQSELKHYALLILLAAILRLALTVGRRIVAGQVSLGVEYDLRKRVYDHLQELELAFFDSQQTGQLMSRATVDLAAVRFFLGYGIIFITQSLLTILLASAAMFIIQPQLAAISLIPVPLVVFISFRYGRYSRPALQEVQQRIAELTADVEENISGIRVVKAFSREQRQLDHFKHSAEQVFDQSLITTKLRAFYNPLIGFLPMLGLAIILVLGGHQVIEGSLSIGEFTAFYVYLIMLSGPMRQLGAALGMSQRAVASGIRLFELLDREPQITSPADAPPLPAGKGNVVFRNVGLTYPGSKTAALSEINLEVASGTVVALVGGTGSGKSSLVSLIPRLYDTTTGQLLIDGSDIKNVDVKSLRHQIALVSEDPFLFSATVAENIAYGRPDASDQEVVKAAEQAQAAGFIAELPDGYDTLIGERGLTLSGGQRQRLAIARALLADPRVLILDDATSAVDPTTEREIRAGLQAAMAGRTTFIVAHRLSTIALADRIVVLERGRIVAEGNDQELLESSELYRQIVDKGMPDRVFLTRKPQEQEVEQ